jgi:hypothetical protein
VPTNPLDTWDWDAEEAELRALLEPELLAAAQIGSQAALLDALLVGADAGITVQWGMANLAAAEWARNYSYELVTQLTDTTRTQLQQVIPAFFDTPGLTRGKLEQLILDGPSGIEDLHIGGRFYPAAWRASAIAVTEVTRAVTQAELITMRELGIASVEADPDKTPPRHVFCRCSISPWPREDGVMSWQYHTRNDELVCTEICAPLNGQDVGVK